VPSPGWTLSAALKLREAMRKKVTVTLESGDWLVTIHEDEGYRAWKVGEWISHVKDLGAITDAFNLLNKLADASKKAALAEEE